MQRAGAAKPSPVGRHTIMLIIRKHADHRGRGILAKRSDDYMSQEIKTPLEDDLRDEYDETLLKNGVRGKYVQRLAAGSNIVRLAPDVAAAFPTEEAVNEALRLLLNVAKTTVRQAS
jgi:hypothetical protein